MTNDQNNQQISKNQWKIALISLITLSVASLVAILFFMIRDARKDFMVTKLDKAIGEKTCDNDNAFNDDNNLDTHYLIVIERELKFKIPSDFNKMSYAINGNRLDFIGTLSSEYVFDYSPNESEEYLSLSRSQKSS